MHWTFRFPLHSGAQQPLSCMDRQTDRHTDAGSRPYTDVRVAHLNPSDSFIYLFDFEFQLLNQKTKLKSW
jgi:hypothetical protein